jgi:hypothetical protein
MPDSRLLHGDILAFAAPPHEGILCFMTFLSFLACIYFENTFKFQYPMNCCLIELHRVAVLYCKKNLRLLFIFKSSFLQEREEGKKIGNTNYPATPHYTPKWL